MRVNQVRMSMKTIKANRYPLMKVLYNTAEKGYQKGHFVCKFKKKKDLFAGF